MALKQTETTPHGFVAVDAYHRVETPAFHSKDVLSFRVRAYKATSLPCFSDKGYECAFDFNGPNPYAQAYQYLKTLPEYATAEDC